MGEFRYRILHGNGMAAGPDHLFQSDWTEENPDYLAEDAAQDYHNNRDGWESSWPLNLAIFNNDVELIGRFTIEREYSPEFTATSLPETP